MSGGCIWISWLSQFSLTGIGSITFCRQKHFELRQTSVFLGICQTLMKRDFAYDSTTDLKSSFDFFEALLLTHSVNRSPKRYATPSWHRVSTLLTSHR
jgi:hypothetical protein